MNKYIYAIGIPILLICCGAVARKLVRGSNWQFDDFYLGVELALAAMASALVYLYDLSKIKRISAEVTNISDKLSATAVFLALCFFLLLWILSTHQDWEKRSQNRGGQFLMLGIIANLIGVGLIAIFVLLIKGV